MLPFMLLDSEDVVLGHSLGFPSQMSPKEIGDVSCVTRRRMRELRGRGGGGWRQAPGSSVLSCGASLWWPWQVGTGTENFGPHQPRRGGSLRGISFQKHRASAHGKGHTGPSEGKGSKLAWVTLAGSYSRASGKSHLLPRKVPRCAPASAAPRLLSVVDPATS